MKYLVKNKYWDIIEDYNLDKLLYLMIDRPIEFECDIIHIWKNNKKQFHRSYDLPTVFWKNIYTNIVWRRNDKIHRENNKPAFIRSNGNKEYWLNNKFIK